MVALCPAHMVVLVGLNVTTGVALTVTVEVFGALTHPPVVPVSV